MKRSIAFALVLMLLSVVGVRCYGAERKVEAVGFAERVVYHSPQTPGYTAWVGLWQLPNGRLRYDCLQLTGTREKPVATVPVFESADGGDTWTRVVNTSTEAVLSPGGYLAVSRDSGRGMAVLPNGTLVRPVWPPEDEKTSGCLERSTDGGKTWGEKIFFLPPAEYRTWPTLIRRLDDGRLVLFAGCWKRGDHQNGNGALPNMTKAMFVSSDEGKTWGQPIVVMPTKQGVCEESDFCELPGGDLFFVHRTEHFPDHQTAVSPLAARMGSSPPQSYWYSDRMQSIVRRQGAGFVPGPCQPAALVHSGFPAVLRTRDGIILHLATTGVHWTPDLGKTWAQLNIPGTPYYPKALERPDGTIVVLGHVGSDDPYGTVDQSIKQQTFRLRASGAP
jgi:hypothetical protein